MALMDATRLRLASPALIAASAAALLCPDTARADDISTPAPFSISARGTIERRAPLVASPSTHESEFAERLQRLWADDPGLRRGTTAVYVADAVTGQVLFSVHEDRGMNAASNVKLVSTATALSALGPDYQFQTVLYGPAPDGEGVVRGDVYLVGSYDMTFHHTDVARMAEELAASGVTRIEGAVRVGEHPTRDTLARSSVKIAVTGSSHGEPPTVVVTPPTAIVHVDASRAQTHRRARRRARLRVSGSWTDATSGGGEEAVAAEGESESEGEGEGEGEDAGETAPAERFDVTIRGRIRPGRTSWYFREVPSAPLFTGHVLHAALGNAGIEVTGGVALGDGKPLLSDSSLGLGELATYRSPPLRSLVARINKPSNNFLADRLIENVGGLLYGGEPSMEKGVRAMRDYLASIGIDPDQVELDTGSGLSYETSLSARQIARTLRAGAGFVDYDAVRTPESRMVAAAGPVALAPIDISQLVEHRVAFINSLAVAGQDGTLRRRFDHSPAVGQVIGKTGTLTSVIALSGFVSEGDDTLVFALVSNGHGRARRRRVRDAHERLTEAMLDYLRARAARRHTVQDAAPPLQ